MFSGFIVDEIQGKTSGLCFSLSKNNYGEKVHTLLLFTIYVCYVLYFFLSSQDFTSDSRGLDISLSSSDTLAGLICCQLWRRRRGDQRWWEVKSMKGIQSIKNLHPYVVDVLRRCRRQPQSNFGEHVISKNGLFSPNFLSFSTQLVV